MLCRCDTNHVRTHGGIGRDGLSHLHSGYKLFPPLILTYIVGFVISHCVFIVPKISIIDPYLGQLFV